MRDEAVDAAILLQRARKALIASESRRGVVVSKKDDFLLRQLLHTVATVEIADESLRRQVEEFAETVLLRTAVIPQDEKESRQLFSSLDLGILVLRQCHGVGPSQCRGGGAPRQDLEVRCNVQVWRLIEELVNSKSLGKCLGGKDGEAPHAGVRTLSTRIETLEAAIEEKVQVKKDLVAQKKEAVMAEDYVSAQAIKEKDRRVGMELEALQAEHGRWRAERDGHSLRILAISTSMLRWTNSKLRRDPVLSRILESLLVPMLSLPAPSVDMAASNLMAIALLCTRDSAIARRHIGLFTTLIRKLSEPSQAPEQQLLVRSRAAIAARALSDCSRLYGGGGPSDFEVAELLGAGSALAVVPWASREVVMEPLCGWLLGCGNVFFQEHLLEPVLEIHWALGWMLAQTFVQTAAADALRDDAGNDDRFSDCSTEVPTATLIRLQQFFAMLPRLPGRHGAPMLSLAVESIAESGLWRRAVLLPETKPGYTRWSRQFSWPRLFAFAHERLPPEMRRRLWTSALQLCVSSPDLAPLAEVPIALEAAAKDAPPGAAELLAAALALGADESALAPLRARMPAGQLSEEEARTLLLPRAEAEAAEQERRANLAELGVDIDVWAPASLETPKMVPPHHRMRRAAAPGSAVHRGAGRGGAKRKVEVKVEENSAAAQAAQAAVAALTASGPAPLQVDSPDDGKRRRKIDWDGKKGEQTEQTEQAEKPQKQQKTQSKGGHNRT
eukprot:gnl/TRDRNA2_/TRDRNA2_155272_c2_seq2.p1 gnl/TRDRNA2_/TRDRNA2_155272_c2~~gnl/TRDRNA2_/TRDRNA2_155272_c2_seq2.p1  ORF type:complete len:749 (-),score=199.40 gnl/TRDRNA2_/TRDRNA2_155272_c2_seq2:7-2190(-)